MKYDHAYHCFLRYVLRQTRANSRAIPRPMRLYLLRRTMHRTRQTWEKTRFKPAWWVRLCCRQR